MPIDSSKFSSNSLTGTVRVTNGFANISLPTAFYALEGNVSFNVQVRTDSTQGAVIYSSPTITLRDTSSFVSLTANTATVNEGDLVAFTLVTAGAAGNSTLYYSIIAGPSSGSFNSANITASDFVANTGSFSLVNNIGTFALKANADLSLMGEYLENFKVQLRTGSTTGNTVYTTSGITIEDTSNAINVLGFVESSASIVEGSNVTFTLTAVNFQSQPGIILYYSTTGNVASFTSNSGSFVMTGVNAVGVSNTFVISNPQVPFNASRSYNVIVRSGSASGPIVATSNTINVIDDALVTISATGGVQSNISGYRVHTFTSSGSITFSKSGEVEYLIIGGGGGGAAVGSGGGGGGLLLSGVNGATPFTAAGGTPYSIVIGSGGSTSTQGTPSTGFGLTAYGGGGGGPGPSGVGTNGGSGGGGSYGGAGKGVYLGSPYISSPVRQGYDGGPSSPSSGAGGGGGAGGAGGYSDPPSTGGGAGLNSSFTGSPYTYSTGGPGTPLMSSMSGGPSPRTNTGGYGAGGTGVWQEPGGGYSGPGFVAVRYSTTGAAFVNITTPANFVYDGSNIVFTMNTTALSNNTLLYYYTVGNVLSSHFVTGNTGSFRTTQNSTAITLQSNTTIPANEERFFQLRITGDAGTSQDPLITSNVFTIKDAALEPKTSSIEYLVVAGGGGGGWMLAGGGGAGGYRTATGYPVSSGSPITVTVGAGGAGNSGTPNSFNGSTGYTGSPGSNSVFGSITSTGGGGGGSYNSTSLIGASGGSGGGAGTGDSATPVVAGGAGNTPPTSPAQGNAGGGTTFSPKYGSGGGGGAGGAGGNGQTVSGAGGIGRQSSISGTATYYAGGGGGGTYNAFGGERGFGGDGGGGNGGTDSSGSPGTVNTGGGGGGSGWSGGSGGGIGGSGIVVIRYPDTFATATTTGSPNVIYANANIIYRFWQSGTITFP